MRRTFAWPLPLLFLVACGVPEVADSFEKGGNTLVVLDTSLGEIVIRLLPDQAPKNAENFLRLCESGYYDQTYFHRVAPGYLIQGGDPNTRDGDPETDGYGGRPFGEPIPLEVGEPSHLRGMVSMARGNAPASAGSQFFIMLGDDPSLDGEYTVFGEVVEGLDVADSIGDTPGRPYPDVGGFNPDDRQYILCCRLLERIPSSDDGDVATADAPY
jgi:peptidyl-prolyl cis-trans isomerase B (cyclophilin B)